ncbi:hypothetical protein M758_UG320500 [Ceratodon purpureus]|nr:hypothetical protein M758_UG320500 [Ceratodon purpureus]
MPTSPNGPVLPLLRLHAFACLICSDLALNFSDPSIRISFNHIASGTHIGRSSSAWIILISSWWYLAKAFPICVRSH